MSLRLPQQLPQLQQLNQARLQLYILLTIYCICLIVKTFDLVFASYIPLYDTLDVWYVHGTKGSRTCHIGSTITTTQECQIACRGLNKKSLPGRDGNLCYIAVNGKCRQDGRYSRKNYPVCKTPGISIIYA